MSEITPLGLGHAAADRAANAAGEQWQREAYEALVKFAKSHPHFTLEEVREAADCDPGERRAWGAIARKAKKEGLITPGDYENSQRLSRHGGAVRRWYSEICNG